MIKLLQISRGKIKKMNINMKNVVLSKKDGWIWINEMVDGQLKPTTKLLYDPRNENDINLIQQQLTQMNDYNMWDLADDYAGTLDLGLEKSA